MLFFSLLSFQTVSKLILWKYLLLYWLQDLRTRCSTRSTTTTRPGILHFHSYTGNALACRAALAVLDIFRDDDVLARNAATATRWQVLAQPLATHRAVQHFRQRGIIIAFDVATPRPDFARWFFAEALARELLLRPIGRTVYFMPPYVVSDAEFALLVTRVADILDQALSATRAPLGGTRGAWRRGAPRAAPQGGAALAARSCLWLFCLAAGAASPAEATLPRPVLQAFDAAQVPLASVGVVVQDVDTARPLLAHQPDLPLNPASVMKLVTSFAALVDASARRWVVVALVNHPNAARAQAAIDMLVQWVYTSAAHGSTAARR